MGCERVEGIEAVRAYSIVFSPLLCHCLCLEMFKGAIWRCACAVCHRRHVLSHSCPRSSSRSTGRKRKEMTLSWLAAPSPL